MKRPEDLPQEPSWYERWMAQAFRKRPSKNAPRSCEEFGHDYLCVGNVGQMGPKDVYLDECLYCGSLRKCPSRLAV